MPCRAPTAAAFRWKEGPQQHLQCVEGPTRVKSHTLLPSLQVCNSLRLKTSKPVPACSANTIRYFLTPRCHGKKAWSRAACCSEMPHSCPRMGVSRLYCRSDRLPGLRDLQIPKNPARLFCCSPRQCVIHALLFRVQGRPLWARRAARRCRIRVLEWASPGCTAGLPGCRG